MRRIVIVGAGQAGCQLALGLLAQGHEVILVIERPPGVVRSGPVLSAQCMFETALAAERALGLNLWDEACPPIRSIRMRVDGVEFQSALEVPARSIDQRLKLAAWMELFEQRGGRLEVAEATVEEVERYAAESDLVVVATAAGALVGLFKGRGASAPGPRRRYALSYLRGADAAEERLALELIPGVGEISLLPGLTTTGPCTIALFAAIPGGPMDRWDGIETADEHLRRTRELLADLLPDQAAALGDAPLADPNGWAIGCATPAARHAVGRLPSGASVLGMADAVLVTDPTAGQGANTAAKEAAFYLERIADRGDEAFDAAWMARVGDDFWRAWSRWVAAWTASMAGPAPSTVRTVVEAAAELPGLAGDVASAMDDPARFHPWWYEPDEAQRMIARHRREAEARFDARDLRRALGQFTTGVTVVTTRAPDGRLVGVTANSFTSVSLDPPLVLWCLASDAPSRRYFEAASRFAVNVLASNQHHLSRQFAMKGEDKFLGVAVEDGRAGLPLLDGALARLECRLVDVIERGDHALLIGEIEDYDAGEGEPLVFHSGLYRIATKHPEFDHLAGGPATRPPNKETTMPSENQIDHPLVVRVREDGYDPIGEGAVDEGAAIDHRDEAEIQDLLSARTVGSTDLSLGIVRMQPGMYHLRHHHPQGTEFYYFTKGTCEVHVDGEDVEAGPGTAIYIPPGCVHAVRNAADEVAEFLYGLSKPNYAEMGLVYDE